MKMFFYEIKQNIELSKYQMHNFSSLVKSRSASALKMNKSLI